MTFTPEDFDAHFDQWKEWPTTPWNRLLYSTSHRNLARHLGDPPLKILDVGGGNGEDALFLAGLGHSVSLMDFSAKMLIDAQKRAEEADLIHQITFHQAAVIELPDIFAGEQFDLVLCHNMIKFVDDGQRLLQDIWGLMKPGGLLSITAVNPYSEVYSQAIFRRNLSAAQAAVGEKQHYHPWFEKLETRHTAESLIEFLEALGGNLLGHYGLRCIIDYLPDNAAKFDPSHFAEIEKLEHDLTDRYPYNLLGRMFQVVVRK